MVVMAQVVGAACAANAGALCEEEKKHVAPRHPLCARSESQVFNLEEALAPQAHGLQRALDVIALRLVRPTVRKVQVEAALRAGLAQLVVAAHAVAICEKHSIDIHSAHPLLIQRLDQGTSQSRTAVVSQEQGAERAVRPRV